VLGFRLMLGLGSDTRANDRDCDFRGEQISGGEMSGRGQMSCACAVEALATDDARGRNETSI